MTRQAIDLNCDLGEGGDHDVEIMPFISTAHIACGGHAGDDARMRTTVALARRHGVAVSAHPGYADRVNFGRRELELSPTEIHALVAGQIRALQAIVPVHQVKPHGALYNQSARDDNVAAAVAAAVKATAGKDAILVGLAGGALLRAGEACGLRVASEVFADRAYLPDGRLMPRDRPEALIVDADAALAQVLRLIGDERVRVDTVCLHGDAAGAPDLARLLRRGLEAAGLMVQALKA